MALFIGPLWVSVSTLFITLFGFLRRIFFRYLKNDDCQTKNLNYSNSRSRENNFSHSTISSETEALSDEADSENFKTNESESSDCEEKEIPGFVFRFPTYEEFARSKKEENIEVSNLIVKELNIGSKHCSLGKFKVLNNGFLSENEFKHPFSEKIIHQEIPENPQVTVCNADYLSEKEQFEHGVSSGKDAEDDEDKLLLEKDLTDSDSDTSSINSSHEFWPTSRFISLSNDEFLSVKDFDGENIELSEEELLNLEDMMGYEPDDFDDEDSDIMEELKKIEETENLKNDQNFEHQANYAELTKRKDSNGRDSDQEESNGLETLWEHQDLIEQLKMELKKVRATGLPTILEESESPKIMDDLKPWKIDDKFHHGDLMDELHKFYKTYRERMRKFDILNYQKMYAIGFLQSKDPLKSISCSSNHNHNKSLAPAITSILSQRLKLCRPKKLADADPMKKFTTELHSDLEIIYVGHMCLSWEFIQWQYDKALDLWESDTYGIQHYNEVASEFQQFQVLLQRFIENETFEGPRVENYAKTRCVTRNLLQVPLIREDKSVDRKKGRRGKDDVITSDMLVEILQESIRIIWRFIRADKDANDVILKCRRGTRPELQDPLDSKLLTEVRAELQKKERKLKEILRSGNCILKRFQKNEEDETDNDLYFFSQVDMKLVSRVLNMSRLTTDQLVWCWNKLNRINLHHRKIHIEPSFFLFPC